MKKKKAPPINKLNYFTLFLLTVSLCFNFFLYFKNNDKASESPKNFMTLNQPISCDNKNIRTKELPPCPKGKGLTILPRHYPLHSIFMGYQENIEQTGLFQSTLNIVSNMNPTIPLIMMVPRQQMDKAVNEIKPYLNSQTRDLVRLIYTPSDYTVWAQDYFEIGVDGKSQRPYFIDLPYDNLLGEHIPTTLAMACNANLLSQASIDTSKEERPAGNFGGNIEALTDKVVIIGNNMSPSQKKLLMKELSQELLEIDVQWLKVGHVDELISVVPNLNKQGSCPFDILYTSPKKALEIIKEENGSNNSKPALFRHGFGSKESHFNLWACYGKDSNHVGCQTMKKINKIYGQIIDKNLSLIKNSLTKNDPSCMINFIPIPVLFTSSDTRDIYGTDKDNAFTIDPNPVNNVLIGDHILLPKQNLEQFHNYTQTQLAKYNIKTTFIDGDYVHYFGGGIHCSMNMRYACRPN